MIVIISPTHACVGEIITITILYLGVKYATFVFYARL
jgi:hypothetical protein